MHSLEKIEFNLKYTTADVLKEALMPLVVFLKFIGIIFVLTIDLILLSPLLIALKHNWKTTKKIFLIPALSIVGKLVLKIMNIDVKLKGDFDIKDGTLITCNHQSYFDLFVVPTFTKAAFITAEETSRMPIVGAFTKLGGCLFINRRTKQFLNHEIENVKEHLDAGINVVLYPEGRCSDGTEMTRFKKPFFAAASEREADIFCLTINYKKVNGLNINSDNKTKILWYRNMPIIKHFFSILKLKGIEIEVIGNKLKHTDYSKVNDLHVAEQAKLLTQSAFSPIL